jgi:GTP-binding protein HflX
MLAEVERRDGVKLISALTGEGVDELIASVAGRLTQGHRRYTIALPAGDGAGAAWLHAHGEVLGHHQDGDDEVYDVRLDEGDYGRFIRRFA